MIVGFQAETLGHRLAARFRLVAPKAGLTVVIAALLERPVHVGIVAGAAAEFAVAPAKALAEAHVFHMSSGPDDRAGGRNHKDGQEVLETETGAVVGDLPAALDHPFQADHVTLLADGLPLGGRQMVRIDDGVIDLSRGFGLTVRRMSSDVDLAGTMAALAS